MKSLLLAFCLAVPAVAARAAGVLAFPQEACPRTSQLAFLIKSSLVGRPDLDAVEGAKTFVGADGLRVEGPGMTSGLLIGVDGLKKYGFVPVPAGVFGLEGKHELLDFMISHDPAVQACLFLNNDNGRLHAAVLEGVREAREYSAQQERVKRALDAGSKSR